MATIELEAVAHSYDDRPRSDQDFALQETRLTIEDGSCCALLGPSGCGKTTLLNILSGLLAPTKGAVRIGGRDAGGLSPRERNIAQVFQFPVVYDTMTVFDNLAFPLRRRGLAEHEIGARVEEIAELLELSDVLPRRARGLGADLEQRISLGRGLVRTDVAAILLDEPLTVIDPQLRWHLRRKLREVHARLRPTLIYVTHDQGEALTIADRVVVMNEGRVLQMGTPEELFERPAHPFVGHFIGSPGMNVLPCRLGADGALVGELIVPLEPRLRQAAAASGAASLQLGIRPEQVRRCRADEGLPATVERVEHQGRRQVARLALNGQRIQMIVGEDAGLSAGESCWIRFPPEHTGIYADGRRIERETDAKAGGA